jgi:hypothetical protein
LIDWSQDKVQPQTESDNEASSCSMQQNDSKLHVLVADGAMHGRNPGVDNGEGCKGRAEECQGVGEDERVKGINPSKHRRASASFSRVLTISSSSIASGQCES